MKCIFHQYPKSNGFDPTKVKSTLTKAQTNSQTSQDHKNGSTNFLNIESIKTQFKNELKCIFIWSKPKIPSKHQINGHEIYYRSNKVKGPWRKNFIIFGHLKIFLNN